jgi:hypothetical protein
MDSEFVKGVLRSMDVVLSDTEAQAAIAPLMGILRDLQKLDDAAPQAQVPHFRPDSDK